MNFSKASHPPAALWCSRPCSQFKGCRQSRELSPIHLGHSLCHQSLSMGDVCVAAQGRCLTPRALEMFLEKALFAPPFGSQTLRFQGAASGLGAGATSGADSNKSKTKNIHAFTQRDGPARNRLFPVAVSTFGRVLKRAANGCWRTIS